MANSYWTAGRITQRLNEKRLEARRDHKDFCIEFGSFYRRYLEDPLDKDCIKEATRLAGFKYPFDIACALVKHLFNAVLLDERLKAVPPLRFFVEPLLCESFTSVDFGAVEFKDLPFTDLYRLDDEDAPDNVRPMLVLHLPERLWHPEGPLSTVGGAEQEWLEEVVVARCQKQVGNEFYCGLQILYGFRMYNTTPVQTNWRAFTTLIPSPNMRLEVQDFPITRLVYNLLLYWSTNKEDVLERINPLYNEVFQRTQRKGVSKKTRRKSQKKLKEMSEKYCNVIGVKFETLQRRAQAARTGKEYADGDGSGGGWKQTPHWRGNYWRLQPCGPGRTERKLIYIAPHLAGRGKAKSEIAVRVKA